MAGYNSGSRVSSRPPAVPQGYESNVEFLLDMRKRYSRGRTADEHNERPGRDDAKFVIGEQWDPDVERKRREKHKPVLTINRLIAFVGQVVNNRLMNETEIRVFPDKAGTKEIAELREGLIRSIYKNSHADLARDEALKYQVIGGQGAFCLSIDYTDNDVFEQDIRLKQVADPYAIVLDDMCTDPTGGDAEWGFVGDDIPRDTFKARWPWASVDSFDSGFQSDTSVPWMTEDSVRVVSYWRMVIDGHKLLALYRDGTVHDVTQMEEFEYAPYLAMRPDGVTPYIREVPNRFARMYLCSGNEILEGPYDYPISSLPIYRVPGWEVSDGERLYRWGLTRFLKDPQRFDNYWTSVRAEQLIAAPRNKWLTTQGAVKGYETRWRGAATSDDPFLFYVDGETAPQHIPPPPIDAALLQESGMAVQTLRDVSNIHEASLGMTSNEVSGKAIQQRQMVSDVGTFIYHDRLRMADERCAKNINELIPHIYDTQRMVTIIGSDNKPVMKIINDPSDPNSSITTGKYGVTVTVGPATVTKRALAAEQMMAFVNAIPGSAERVMDLVADAQDWPKAGEFAKRFRMMLPDGTIPEDEMTPEMIQMAQQKQQMQQMQSQLELANAKAEISKKEADANLALARAKQAEASAYKAISDAKARMMDVESKVDDTEFRQTLDALDQHNDMIGEDRTFDVDLDDRKNARNQENTNGK